MRIITGTARGCRLLTLEGENTRPTSERAKEAVFSMLRGEIRDKKVLDVFAGSGQMALEALSQGADFAYMIDRSADVVGIIGKNAEKTRLSDRCRIIRGEAPVILDRIHEKFGLVFADPPYASGLLPQVLRRLDNKGLLENGAYVVCESASPDDVFGDDSSIKSVFNIFKTGKYGIAYITILKYMPDART